MKQSVNFLSTTSIAPYLSTVGHEELLNFYLKLYKKGDVQKLAAIYTPGTYAYLDLNVDKTRGALSINDKGYVVGDNKLFLIENPTTSPSFQELVYSGATWSTTNNVSMSSNNSEVIINDGTNVIYHEIGTLSFSNETSTIGIPNNQISFVTTFKGFTFYGQKDSKRFYASAYEDALNVSDFFNANTDSNLVVGVSTKTYMYMFSNTDCEVWGISGNTGIPIDPVPGGNIDLGTSSPLAWESFDNKLFGLVRDESGVRGVAIIQGSDYKIVSDDLFVKTIKGYSSIDDAYCWRDTHDGHVFLNITFPSANTSEQYDYNEGATWTYDPSLEVWFKRSSYDSTTQSYEGRHLTNCTMNLGNKQIVGDFKSGSLYILSQDYSDENGNKIKRRLRTPVFWANDEVFSVYELQITTEQGRNPVMPDDGSPPQFTLRWSKDYGNTWSPYVEKNVPLTGDFKSKIKQLSCGGGSLMQFEIQTTDSIGWIFSDMTAQMEIEDDDQ
jgi:hypothetical protein